MNRSGKSLTRRELAAAFAAATPLVAQQRAATPEDLEAVVGQQMKRTLEKLRTFRVPIATEPSFVFRP